jgi:hypothetical protein
VDYGKFLVEVGIKLKPKSHKDLDQYLLGQLTDMRSKFGLENEETVIEDLIERYYKSFHRSSAKRELGRDAFAV